MNLDFNNDEKNEFIDGRYNSTLQIIFCSKKKKIFYPLKNIIKTD